MDLLSGQMEGYGLVLGLGGDTKRAYLRKLSMETEHPSKVPSWGIQRICHNPNLQPYVHSYYSPSILNVHGKSEENEGPGSLLRGGVCCLREVRRDGKTHGAQYTPAIYRIPSTWMT